MTKAARSRRPVVLAEIIEFPMDRVRPPASHRNHPAGSDLPKKSVSPPVLLSPWSRGKAPCPICSSFEFVYWFHGEKWICVLDHHIFEHPDYLAECDDAALADDVAVIHTLS